MAEPPSGQQAWVVLVNEGGAGPLTDSARRPFTLDDLLGEARARLGVADRGPSDIGGNESLEPLEVLLPALEREAHLTLLGRWLTRRFLLRLLTVRMHLERYVRDDPGVRDEPVAAPLVVTGPPRSGTTLLHGLLAQDPALRAPLGWELLWPVPPPVPDTAATDPRIALAEQELRAFAAVRLNLDTIHEYGARNPKECVSAMSFAFRSEEFTARYRVPSYAHWLRACDMAPAYAMHRLVLAVLARRSPRRRWVLKSPVHLHSLDVLLATYPDALVVITHREPLRVLASVTSLVTALRSVHSDEVDPAEVGAYHAELYHSALDGLARADAAGRLPAGQVHHVAYGELAADPLATVRDAYRAYGLALSEAAERRMADHAAARPAERHGSHDYSFDTIGLDRARERDRFAGYRARFGTLLGTPDREQR